MIKSMCMIRNGKYVYWTEKGSRCESSEPIQNIELEQLEEYESWSS